MNGTYGHALAILGATPPVLAALLPALPVEVVDRRPSTDGWSVREVLEHLRYVEEAVIGARIRQMLREDDPPLAPAAPSAPSRDNVAAILAGWQAARAGNLQLLRGLTEAQRQRTGRHARYGTITVGEHVVEWAYHDLDHLRQVMAAVQVDLYPAIGPFQALYPAPA